MVRVGLVTEGPIDADVLRAIVREVRGPIDFVTIQPDVTLASVRTGWQGVRAWCRENGRRLGVLMSGVPERPIHLLVIHIDCSMADKVDAQRACPPARRTADALREVVREDWLQLDLLPGYVVLATPSMFTDAWLLAALDLPSADDGCFECDYGPEGELNRRKVIRNRDDGRKRRGKKFDDAIGALVANLDAVCDCCSEAERFRSDLIAAVPGP